MKEVWKSVVGYAGLYHISNQGRIFRLKNYSTIKYLKFNTDKDGYFKVSLCKNNKPKSFYVHRLVAEAFIENPENLPLVNHKDENKTNNKADNLEWCTAQYNTTYNGSTIKRGLTQRIPIIQLSLNLEPLKIWSGRVEIIQKLGFHAGNITSCCLGHRKTSNGFIWRYLKDIKELALLKQEWGK